MKRFVQRVVTDITVHSICYKEANCSIADAAWFAGNNMMIPYMFSNSFSQNFISQTLASATNFARFVCTLHVSNCDMFFSNVAHRLIPNIEVFQPFNSKKRMYKRVMLTMKRNGGVYYDMFNICRTLSVFTPYNYLFMRQPLSGPRRPSTIFPYNKNNDMTKEMIKRVIENDLHIRYDDNFTEIEGEHIDNESPMRVFKAKLLTGEKVNINVIQPNTYRMRKLDLFPFRVIRFVSSVVPFIQPEKKLLEELIRRVDFSIPKEYSARMKFLESFGFDTKDNFFSLMQDANDSKIGIDFSVPYSKFTNKYVMVTSPSSPTKAKITPSIIGGIGLVAGKLLWNGYALTDLSESNIRVSKGKLSFSRYYSLSRLTPADIMMCARKAPFVNPQININEKNIWDFINGSRNIVSPYQYQGVSYRTFRSAFGEHAEKAFRTAELFGSISQVTQTSLRNGFKALEKTPFESFFRACFNK